jgi:hypothetical protein
MTDPATPRLLTLREGIAALCDPDLVRAVLRAEGPFAPEALDRPERPHLGGGTAPHEPDRLVSPGHMRREHALLDAAWDGLLEDFRLRVEAGRIHLSGVQVHPDPQEVRTAIPGVWAATYRIDYKAGTLTGAGRGYVSVRLSAEPVAAARPPAPAAGAAPPPSAPAAPAHRGPITEARARGLTDDELFLLLEEYARRVVEEEGTGLKMPVKISYVPIVRRKMRHRAERGELRGTLAAEAADLAEWIKTRASSHQTPTAGTLENELRDDYRELKARSKGIIP